MAEQPCDGRPADGGSLASGAGYMWLRTIFWVWRAAGKQAPPPPSEEAIQASWDDPKMNVAMLGMLRGLALL